VSGDPREDVLDSGKFGVGRVSENDGSDFRSSDGIGVRGDGVMIQGEEFC
jgi:hypothetical protein